jgi:hypothetical protein
MEPLLEPATISTAKMVKSILFFGTICCILYVLFLSFMKSISLMQVTGFRLINYVMLCMVCLYQINRWINESRSYVPFLQVFFTAFFTGVWSFILFTLFLFIYGRFNVHITELFVKNVSGVFISVPFIVILLEGIAASVIVALINMQYFLKYEKGKRKENGG